MSLTTTSKKFKTGVKVLGIVMGIYYLAILFVIPTARDFFLNLFVDRNPPNPKYGLLDPLQFQPTIAKGKIPTPTLDTKDGRLPAGMPRKMTVYRFKGIQYSYLAGKTAQQDANILGYSESELISDLKGKEYVWRSLTSGGTLNINTETRSIVAGVDLFAQDTEYPAGKLTVEIAKQQAISIFKSLNRYDENLYKPENMKVRFAEFAGGQLRETKAISDAQLARVDFYGKIGDYWVLGPNPKSGIIWITLRIPNRETPAYNYPFIDSYFWDLTKDNDASYPIITVQEAWKQVAAGKGILASVLPKNANIFEQIFPVAMEKILIQNIYLAYYETPQFQRYLQPIYVFEGNYNTTGTEGGSVTFYYPAVTAEFTSKVPPQLKINNTNESTSSAVTPTPTPED